MTNIKSCKAETEGHCSFDCIDCCYTSKIAHLHFQELYNLNSK